jgi:hypothetical protein
LEILMAGTYAVVDLTAETPAEVTYESGVKVNPEKIAAQLNDIATAVAPIVASEQTSGGFGLQSVAITLTVGAEGGVAFVAKGSAEASITLTLGRSG